MHEPANDPNDLERFFVERANVGDIDGVVALYEPHAVLISGDGEQFVGTDQIRNFFVSYLAEQPQHSASDQSPALVSDEIALTSSHHNNGDVSAEVARRQQDGTWLWVVDQFNVRSKL